MENYLIHFGRLGQKWGVRNGPPYPLVDAQGNRVSDARYGSLNGKTKSEKYREKAEKYRLRAKKDWIDRDYALKARRMEKKAKKAEEKELANLAETNETLFISGSSKTQDKTSNYYRKELPADIKKEINKAISEGKKIVVGDAPGIDTQVQDFLKSKGYMNVEIYGPGKQVRYLANSRWNSKTVDAPEFEIGSREWLAKKDIEMSNISTEGLAVILDEGSNATRNNISRLIEQNKDVKVYQLSNYSDKYDRFVKTFTYDQVRSSIENVKKELTDYRKLPSKDRDLELEDLMEMEIEDLNKDLEIAKKNGYIVM